MSNTIRLVRFCAGLAVVAAILSGCAAASISIAKRDLNVQTKTSSAIFVDPVPPADRTLYVEVRSGVSEFDRHAFSTFLREQFAKNENGYRIVNDPEQAHYIMLAYVLSLEKASEGAAVAALKQGYVGGGDIATGATTGALVGSHKSAYRGAAIGSLLAGGTSLVANALVQDVTYVLICDVSVRERVARGLLVRKDTSIDAKVSDTGSSQQRVSEASDRKEYRTRIVTTANKANLKLEEAQALMYDKTAYAMAGFF
jgi:Enterobacterial TraT complement resistance protein